MITETQIVREWKQPLKVMTFFSGGFGSIELAMKYEKIDHEILVACEIDEAARESYLLNHGEPTREFPNDITKFNGQKYKDEVDLMHLSPPCQSYSTAGNREGESCIRGNLMYEAVRVIDEVRPKIFTIENVPGLISSGNTLKNIISDLKAIGYQVSWHKMSAEDYGSPQTRGRVFIVGFYGTGATFPTPQKQKLGVCIGDLLEQNVDKKYYLSQKALDGFSAKTKKIPSLKLNPKSKNGAIGTLTARYQKNAITDPYIFDPKLMQVGNVDQKGHNSLWGRVYSKDGLAPTQNANGGGMGAKTGLFSLEDGIRRLTPREGARAMGDTKDAFKFGDFKDNKLYFFIGNAIDINTYRVLLVSILEHQKSIDFSKKFIAQKRVVQTALF